MMRLLILLLLCVTLQARSWQSRIAADDVKSILSEIAQKDVNGGGEDEVVTNFQNMASHKIFSHDNAAKPLFTSVSDRIKGSDTMKAFETLQALYTVPEIGEADENSDARVAAANSFLDEVMKTDVMTTAMNFLSKAGLAAGDAAGFKKQLFDLWFTSFSRSTVVDSSSFESVFIGETHSGDVHGLNYWYRFYLLEQANQVNYHGYFTREKGVQVELQFAWGEEHALMDSFLLGTSPEFDMAAYTICALADIGDCTFTRFGQPVDLTVKTLMTPMGVKVIDSVYPSQNGETPSEPVTKKPTTKKPAPSGDDSKLQKAVDEMRANDVDKPTDYQLNWGKPRSGQKDVTTTPLYTSLNEDIFKRPIYKALNQMYDAEVFSPDVCVKEPDMTGFRKQYIMNVFKAFTNTTVFQIAFKYLQDVGVAKDWASFEPKLWTLWMGTYSRCSGTLGSSGFEHVFSGEWKSSKVDGQHCWVKYYRHEKKGEINYHGYISYDDQLTGTFQYTWERYLKNVGGFNTGTSPGQTESLQKLIEEMRAEDIDKPVNYSLNWGNRRYGTTDMSPLPLFSRLDEELFKKPVYKLLINAFDSDLFTPNVCIEESDMSGFKRAQLLRIFNVFTNTSVFQTVFNYLQGEGYASTWQEFMPKLWALWMGTYSRCYGIFGSSGFEHVFFGEWKGRKVSGQHSWIKYYTLEKKGEINYHGYISHYADLIGTIQYTWLYNIKKIGGFFTGTSPAFDFALYTVCALARPGKGNCVFQIDGYIISVVTYTERCQQGICLLTAYSS
uniref:Endoribonuclease n=1 Tax=Syphacia muris TaxID=451379 RepID=A0A0N5ATK8_9BILA